MKISQQALAAKADSPRQQADSAGQQPGTRLRLNMSGNLRGMHGNQPKLGSEHMRKLRAMQRLDNNQLPNLACSNCAFSANCPKFRAGYECAFIPFLKSHRIESEDDLMFYMGELCTSQMQRAQLLLIFERLQGGKPDLETSESLAHAFDQLNKFQQVLAERGKVTIEVDTDDGSIIGKLFGSLDQLVHDTESAQLTPQVLDSAGEANLLADAEQDVLLDENSTNPLVRELAKLKEIK